jgi:hypothetical protein
MTPTRVTADASLTPPRLLTPPETEYVHLPSEEAIS